MEVHTYIVNPFADIICTTCQYVVKVNTSCTLFAALYQHERRNRNHPFPHDEDKRKVIAAQLQSQMKEVVMNVWSLLNEDINLANDRILILQMTICCNIYLFPQLHSCIVKYVKY